VCDLPSEHRGGTGAASAREAGSGNRRVSSAHIHPTATPPLNIAGPMKFLPLNFLSGKKVQGQERGRGARAQSLIPGGGGNVGTRSTRWGSR